MSLTLIAIICGVLAVIYGFVTSRQVLSASAGNEKMQEIAAAIQEGAQAYLGRQYRTIAIVGVVVAVLVFAFLGVIPTIGFVIGAAVFSDDLARWQWRLYGLLAATAAGFGLVAIHRYGQAQGYW